MYRALCPLPRVTLCILETNAEEEWLHVLILHVNSHHLLKRTNDLWSHYDNKKYNLRADRHSRTCPHPGHVKGETSKLYKYEEAHFITGPLYCTCHGLCPGDNQVTDSLPRAQFIVWRLSLTQMLLTSKPPSGPLASTSPLFSNSVSEFVLSLCIYWFFVLYP